MTAAAVAAAVRAGRYAYTAEADLQLGIRDALIAAGYAVVREARLDAASRVDLLVGRVAVEVKVNGSAVDVERQVRRYLASGMIDSVVLVTSRVAHLAIDVPGVVIVPIVGGGYL